MNEVIADIYHAAAGTKPWSEPLTRITQELALHGSQLVGVSAATGAVLFSHASANSPPEADVEYLRSYHGLDPRIPLLIKSSERQWLYDQDAFDEQTILSNPYYRDLLMPYGARYSASAKLLDRDGEVVMVAFMSHLREPGFLQRHREYLQAISFHLREAIAIYQSTRKLKSIAVAGAELLQRMQRPALLLGTDRSVTFMNDKARQYLGARNILFLSSDRLVAFEKQTDEELSNAFHAVAKDIAAGGVPKRRVLRVLGHHGDAAALSLTPFVPGESMFAFGNKPQVLITVHERGMHASPDILLWEAAFNLTPSQSRVALEMCRGNNINEAAASLKIAPTTVKSHLKELYWKTATSRQSQLVLALANLQEV